MIAMIAPMIRNNICINTDPIGCKKNVEKDINYVLSQKQKVGLSKKNDDTKKPINALIIGASSGYGLASRIVAAFAYGATTFGVSYERAETEKKTGSPGWYNNRAFEYYTKALNNTHITIEGDAFSSHIKKYVVEEAKKHCIKFDLIIYSLASYMRVDETTGYTYKSVIKPIDSPFNGKTINIKNNTLEDVHILPASEEEIYESIKVMGGEDWSSWISTLDRENLLGDGVISFAYSYMGGELTHSIYKYGSIGRAKKDLYVASNTIREELKSRRGVAFVSLMRAIATRSSAIIPSLPLYLSCLFTITKRKGIYEEAIEQVFRLFSTHLYSPSHSLELDHEGYIRCDADELRIDVQKEVLKLINRVIEKKDLSICDVEGYKKALLATNGFDLTSY